MDLNYYKTLIAVADDCPVADSVIPQADAGKKKTIAALQYELLSDHPYVHTQEDVLFRTWLARQDLPELSADEEAQLRADFFAKPQACLRASPLPKKYGFGLLFDDKGRIALCPRESKEYTETVASGRVKVVKAMRTSRG